MRKLVLIAVLAGITARGNSKPQQTSDDVFLCLLTGMCSVDTTGLPKPVSITSEISTTPRPIGGDPFLCSLVTSSQQCSEPEIANKCKIKCSVGEDPFLCSLVTSTEQCSEPEIARQCRFLCSGVSNPCSCVKFHECCDPESSDPNHPALIDERIRNAHDGNCPGLTVCCKTKCKREERPSIINNNPSTLPARPLTQPPAPDVRPAVIPTEEDGCGLGLKSNVERGLDKITEPSEFPWLALIGMKIGSTFNQMCGGTLITKQHVISAAHCFKRKSEGIPIVRLGEYNVNTDGDGAQEFEIIDKRNLTVENDIILLKLDRPLDSFTDTIRAACLPYHLHNDRFEENRLVVAGWGTFDNSRPLLLSPVPMKSSVSVVPLQECQRAYKKISTHLVIDETQLCAESGGAASCIGNGGGPLIYLDVNKGRFYVVGLASFGPTPCGASNLPDVYTRIGHFLALIEESIRDPRR